MSVMKEARFQAEIEILEIIINAEKAHIQAAMHELSEIQASDFESGRMTDEQRAVQSRTIDRQKEIEQRIS